MGITTHVLDTSRGHPASGIHVTLEILDGTSWRRLGNGLTDEDGRLRTLLGDTAVEQARYRITFDTGSYYAQQGIATFFPAVAIVFDINDALQHYHVPLLLSPFGYSTYRGS